MNSKLSWKCCSVYLPVKLDHRSLCSSGMGNQDECFSECGEQEIRFQPSLTAVTWRCMRRESSWECQVGVTGEGQGRQRCGAEGLLPVWGGKYQKNGREERNHRGCRWSIQNEQTENEGAKDEVGGIISPVLHPELQVCCSILE